MIITGVQNESYNERMHRDELIHQAAAIITSKQTRHPLRVAVDGVDASGKTLFADELARALAASHRQVIRASVDGFHHPAAERWRQGTLSPQGFYRDSYNYPALLNNLLLPLSPQGDRRFRTAVFDVRKNCPLDQPWQAADEDAILIFDGIFLHRPTLLPYWDLSIFLHVDFDVAVSRGIARDGHLFSNLNEALLRYRQRYVPGQKIYLEEASPLDKADILIDNNNLDDPEWMIVSDKPKKPEHQTAEDYPKWRNP